MYLPLQNSFREDLMVTQKTNSEDLSKRYLIKDPISGETFEFGEEEYFLCQSMNGTSKPSEIIAEFKTNFGLSLTEEDFNEFSKQIVEFGLLESFKSKIPIPTIVSGDNYLEKALE